MGPAPISIFQVSSKEVSLFQVRPSQGSSFHVRPLENSPLQVRLTEIRPLQAHPRHMTLLQSRGIPLLTSESPACARQRQFAQVHLAQVRTTQIQPPQLPLLPIIPINRPLSLFMRGEQPFNIGASEFDVFEGVDASLDVRLYGEALGKEFLAVEVNLRFSAPGVLCFVCLLLHQVCPFLLRVTAY